MRVTCDRCGSSYTLPEARVAPGRRLQFQCRQCQHRIIVQIPTENEVGVQGVERTPQAPPTVARVLWFISTAGGQQQRLDTDGVRTAIAEHSVVADTWLWRKGMAEWSKAGEVADFAMLFGEPDSTRAMEPVAAPIAAPPQATGVAPTTSPRAPGGGAHDQAVVELGRPAMLVGSNVAGAASVHKGAGFQTDQRAIPMPIIRVTTDGAEAIGRDLRQRRDIQPASRANEPLRPPAGNRAARPAAQAQTPGEDLASLRPELRSGRRPIKPRDGSRSGAEQSGRTSAYAAMPDDDEDGQDGDKSKGPWSPATDTYQGQRSRHTRKVEDRDRESAIEWAAAMERRDAEAQSLRKSLQAWQRLAFAGLIALVVLLLLTALLTVRMRDAQEAAARCPAQVEAP